MYMYVYVNEYNIIIIDEYTTIILNEYNNIIKNACNSIYIYISYPTGALKSRRYIGSSPLRAKS